MHVIETPFILSQAETIDKYSAGAQRYGEGCQAIHDRFKSFCRQPVKNAW